jgi:glycine dehydrogenase subunit 1
MHPYLPHTDQEIKEMLAEIGVDSIEELFRDIPEELRLDRELKIDDSKSEIELRRIFNDLVSRNTCTNSLVCFLGAGAYDHYIPSIVDFLSSRSEFYTAYTPYQPEMSQGTLQVMFEYQTMIAELTGMDVSNASLYDGASACAEAMYMANATTRKDKVLVSKAIHPNTLKVLRTYADAKDLNLVEVDVKDGQTDYDQLEEMVDKDTAAVIIQSPNFFGVIEDVEKVEPVVHKQKRTLLIQSADPLSLAVLKSPGEMGVDIAVGDGQVFGIPLSFGGPYLGYIAVKKNLMRKLPGRIAGQTEDTEGNRGFVLTLQAREQHIRRHRATSNITSNQALMATRATIYLAALGKEGLKEVATQTAKKAAYAAKELVKTGKYEMKFNKPFFREFVVTTDCNVDEVNENLLNKGILGGYDLSQEFNNFENTLMISVTEKRTKEEIDMLVREMGECHV